jgi:uncharacterized membrane protein
MATPKLKTTALALVYCSRSSEHVTSAPVRFNRMTENPQKNDSAQAPAPITPESDVESSRMPSERQNWLKSRVAKWRESGIISEDQSNAILNYEAAPVEPFRLGLRFNRLIVVLSTLGAILIGAGLISFVAANWQGIPAIAKLALLIGGQTATYWVAYQLQFRRGYPKIGVAIMFTGAAWFGANVFLVAQSYHLATDNPNLLIWWFLGILPLAYITRSKPITVMAVGIFTIGISWKAATWADNTDSPFMVMGSLLMVAAALYAIGMLHLGRVKLRFHAGPYLVVGALLAIGMTYFLTFDDILRESRSGGVQDFQAMTSSYILLAAVISGIAIAALAVAMRNTGNLAGTLASRYGESSVVVLVVGMGWLVASNPFETSTPYVITFNLLLIVLIFGSIVLGIVNKREALVNVGIVFFVIDLSTRYIELTVDMLDTSLAFIVGGLLLLGVGYGMERARRKLLSQFGIREITHDS